MLKWALTAVALAILISNILDSDLPTNCSMANRSSGLMDAFRAQNKTAFVLGYTGAVGKEIVKEIVENRLFSKVVLIGRRAVQYDSDLYKDVEQRIVDFEKLDDYADSFKDIDIGYCALGTTRAQAGADGFYRVDHDYIVNSARIAKQAGCSQFHLISSQGADKSSSLLYMKTKGEVEEELKAMEFPSLVIYRPAMLLCKRDGFRLAEKASKVLLKPISWAFPTFITVPTTTVARAAVYRTVAADESLVQMLDNKAIHQDGACEQS